MCHFLFDPNIALVARHHVLESAVKAQHLPVTLSRGNRAVYPQVGDTLEMHSACLAVGILKAVAGEAA